MNTTIKRTFFPGEKWLFFKIYTGQKTSDVLLSECLAPMAAELLVNGMIDQWFFIRYEDPKHHLRIRFRCTDITLIGKIINTVFFTVQELIDEGFIWSIQLDTYQRELERYGSNTIELSEKLFFHDSQMIVNFLGLIEGEEGEKLRWLFALRAMYSFLDSFEYTDDKKLRLMETLKTSFGQEFGMSRPLKKQLDEKYRNHRGEIEAFMGMKRDQAGDYSSLLNLLKIKEKNILHLVQATIRLKEEDNLKVAINNFLASHLHMLMNRLFPAKNRLHELVCYDFLYRYIRSKIAKNNKEKKQEFYSLPKAINQ